MKRRFLLIVAVMLVLSACGGTSPPRLWGAFTERGMSNVAMKPAINVRMFTDVNLDAHGHISCNCFFGHQNGAKVDGISLQLTGRYRPTTRSRIWSPNAWASPSRHEITGDK